MNLLFISADAHFVDPESEVSRRHRQYAQYFQTLGGKKIIIITRYDEGKKQIFWEDDFLKVLGFKKGPLLFFKMLFGAWRCGKQ